MKPIQADELSRAERAALRRLREQVRQQRQAQSRPASKPVPQPKQDKTSA